MNKKRWVAVAIAIVILVISAFTPTYKAPQIEDAGAFDSLTSLFDTQDSISEEVLEQGDDSSRILQLSLNGAITSGNSSFVNNEVYNHHFFLTQLDKVLKDESIKGILFLVNTPGGGVYESAEIRNAILKIKKQRNIPIYVSMLNMAASGGYYVSADATKIYATEETWTGSIGVILQSFNFKELLDKHGIYAQTYKSGEFKDMGSPYGDTSEAEKAVFQSMIDEAYDKFVSIISNGRGMSDAEVRKIADGRIYTAKQAVANHLVDKIAYPEQVLADLRTENGLENSTLFKYTYNPANEFFNMLTHVKTALHQPSELSQVKAMFDSYYNRGPQPYYIYGGH